MTFNELNILQPVQRALDDMNYVTPTPIQQKTIPVAVAGQDVLGIAQTGTGKTAAFAIPIIEQLLNDETNTGKGKRRIKALVLTPTRELAIQNEQAFADYGKYTDLRHTVVFGGVNQNPQVKQLIRGTDILIATPGRLLDLIGQGFIKLDGIKYFVLDEADRMLDMGFITDINRLLPLLPQRKQTMLFSATMPKEVEQISKSLLHNPAKVEVTPSASVVDAIEQHIYLVEKVQKSELLVSLLTEQKDERVLVFSRTKHGADKIARILARNQIRCEAIHGNKSQNARQTALCNFKSGKTRIIVATDIAARGLDIQDLGLVINYDMPDAAETYVHRIGRTGRAGKNGVALSFCSSEERSMFKSIQKLIGRRLEASAFVGSAEGQPLPQPEMEMADEERRVENAAGHSRQNGAKQQKRGERGCRSTEKERNYAKSRPAKQKRETESGRTGGYAKQQSGQQQRDKRADKRTHYYSKPKNDKQVRVQ